MHEAPYAVSMSGLRSGSRVGHMNSPAPTTRICLAAEISLRLQQATAF
jgi:hypothetical protein